MHCQTLLATSGWGVAGPPVRMGGSRDPASFPPPYRLDASCRICRREQQPPRHARAFACRSEMAATASAFSSFSRLFCGEVSVWVDGRVRRACVMNSFFSHVCRSRSISARHLVTSYRYGRPQ